MPCESIRRPMATNVPSVLFRKYQADALNTLVNEDPTLSPPNLIIQGQQSSGKTWTVKKFFEVNPQLLRCWMNPVESVSWKPLLQNVARMISLTLANLFPQVVCEDQDALEAEDFYLLVKFLGIILNCYQVLDKKVSLFVVLDGFDQLQELDSELLPKFLKLHELLSPNLKIQLKFLYIVRDTSFVSRYATYMVPTIVFPRYNYEQATAILLQEKMAAYMESQNLICKVVECGLDPEDSIFERIAENHIKIIVQAFHSYTGNDIAALSDLMDSKWDSYVQSITTENINEPLALYRSNIDLYTSTGDTFVASNDPDVLDHDAEKATAYELDSISKFLLIAAYLCSYLEPRYDSKIFSKKSHLRAGRSSYGRRTKMDTNPRFLQPSHFPLERLFSIFQAIFPVDQDQEENHSIFHHTELMRANVEVYENLAELNSLKLITTATPKNVDYLSSKLKWKVNIPWEIITEIAATVKFDIADYFSGLHY